MVDREHDDHRLRRLLRAFAMGWGTLGVRGALLFWCQRLGMPLERSGGHLTLRSRSSAHPLYARPGTTDAFVFRQIFLEREYACIDDLDNVHLVLDCGANVGYSAAYFLARHPRAKVVAVEPDEGNHAMLALNTAPYRDRVTVLRAAVWSHPANLVIDDGLFRDGGEWTRQVREARPGEADVLPAVTVGTLLRDSGHQRISILKVDIEGAEAVVFADGYEPWLSAVDTLVIELHADSAFGDCARVFHQAIAGHGFVVSRVGELTVCRRRPPGPG
jgi:FkbM family methyltransferase